jgi:hypothetical protein
MKRATASPGAGDGAVTPVLSGTEADHEYNGEREQDGGNANSKCECDRHEPLTGLFSRGQAR